MLHTLHLFDFRNYADRSFTFGEQVVFWGNNGQGKTNILEAISVLSTGKSWRETTPQDLIRQGSDTAMIRASLVDGDQYQVQVLPRSRITERNGKKITRKRHLGNIPTLLFVPEHLMLFSGNKLGRQQYFDRFLCQLSPNYAECLIRCTRAKTQKNAVLKAHRQCPIASITTELSPWNTMLAETIPLLFAERQSLLSSLNPLLTEALARISGTTDSIRIELTTPEIFEPTGSGVLTFFRENEFREVAAQRCLLGPHRDDFTFFLRDHPICSTASRGETRSILLALLAAKKILLQQQYHRSPILLLDDVFSELDAHRQTQLEQICTGSQVFFTTTHQEHFVRFSGEIQKIYIFA